MQSLHAHALRRAVEILGGVPELSRYIQVPRATVMRWITGQEKPTSQSSFEVVDLLLDHDLGKLGSGKSSPRRK